MVDFKLELKLCDSEVEMAADANHSDVFDAMTPEGSYELNLAKQYDQIVLQNLLSLSQEVAELSTLNPGEAFEQKSCF